MSACSGAAELARGASKLRRGKFPNDATAIAAEPAHYFPRLRALALFGLAECPERPVIPESKNLHNSSHGPLGGATDLGS